jgi:UDP-glucuronate 4-epimerase
LKTILVTGAAGFIGSHLCERLLELNFKVIGVDNFDPFYDRKIKETNLKTCKENNSFLFYELSILDINELNNLEIDCIVHLAAKAGVRPSLLEPKEYIESNILGTQCLLDFAINKNIKKFIFASSSSVYGNNQIPFKESDSVDNPISVYAYTKKCGELMLATYHNLYQLNYIALRFFTVYGPRQRPDLAINKFVNLIKKNEIIELFGDGNTARDYTYVDDIIEGIIGSIDYIIYQKSVAEIINLGNNKPIKLNELVNLLFLELKKERNVTYKEMQSGDVNFTFADISKAQNLLNYNPSISFVEGIRKYINSLNLKFNK